MALPAHQYVTTGTPVADCDSIAVTWTGIYGGVPAVLSEADFVYSSGSVARSIVFAIWIFRCVVSVDDDGNPPTTTSMQTDARTIMTDAYTLHRGLARAKSEGTFRGACESYALGPCIALEPQGNIAGCQMTLQAELS